MPINFKNYISCAVVFFPAWLVACTNEVTVANSCAADCEEKYPDGLRILNKYIGGCACRTCSDACTQSVCLDKETPSNACLPCFQEGLSGRCSQHDGFFEGGCLEHKECADLITCITACGR